jgi:dTDP-4-dehydrorhamnose 3,5-epimerase
MSDIIQTKIDGVWIKPLRKIPDERGMIMHMLRADEPSFGKFGEIYFSVGIPGSIKGWHKHTRQSQNYAVIQGMIKLVLYDERQGSISEGKLLEIFTGEDKYELIHIPPGVVNGYKTYGMKLAIVANCADIPHDPDEMIRYDPLKSHINYNWDIIHR